MNGQINDCNCKFETVDNAVSNFFIPLLANITSRPFFRYFKIDLEKPCPFWEDDGAMCTNEGCSICPCEPDEVPIALLTEEIQNSKHEGLSDENEYGWISRAGEHGKPGGSAHSDRLGKVQHESVDDIHLGETHSNMISNSFPLDSHSRPLEQNWEWTEISEDSRGVFVNLVKNPEKFTGLNILDTVLLIDSGYSGLSARLVWKSIQEENCFGGDTDACFEKRVFYRFESDLLP